MGVGAAEPVAVSFTVTDDDYRALARFLCYETPKGRESLRRYAISAVVLPLVAGGVVYAIRPDLVLAALVAAFALVLMQVLRRSAAQKRANRIYGLIRPRNERRMEEPGTITLTPEGIEARYKEGAGKVPWRGVTQVGRDATHVFIILGQVNALAVPMRDFGSPRDFEHFYQTAVEYHAEAFAESFAPPAEDE